MPGPVHTPSGWVRSRCGHGNLGCCSQIQPSRHFPHVLVLGSVMSDPRYRAGAALLAGLASFESSIGALSWTLVTRSVAFGANSVRGVDGFI